MKNVQVIDGALNCDYPICEVDENVFREVFPADGQEIEFVEDLVARVGRRRAGTLVRKSTTRRVEKTKANGIHGTLFIQMGDRRTWFPNKRWSDAQRAGEVWTTEGRN